MLAEVAGVGEGGAEDGGEGGVGERLRAHLLQQRQQRPLRHAAGPSEKTISQLTPKRAMRADSRPKNSSGSVSGTSRQSMVAVAVPGTTFSL